MLNDNLQFGFLDLITIFTAILQTMDYELTLKQASNDDILRELKKICKCFKNKTTKS